MSFVAIQELQRELEANPGGSKDKKRSLKEIQEEEQARQVEADFLRWWAEEEERLRLEQIPPDQAQQTQTGKRSKGKKRAEGLGDALSGVQAGKTAPREGGAKREGGRKDGRKREGGKREGAPKDSPRHDHAGSTLLDGSAAEGRNPSSTERRRRQPGPKNGGKPEVEVAGP